MSFKSTVTGGANLTHPHMSFGWIIGGIIAVVLLLAVFVAGKWIFGKAAAPVAAITGNMPAIGSNATQTTESAGWIY